MKKTYVFFSSAVQSPNDDDNNEEEEEEAEEKEEEQETVGRALRKDKSSTPTWPSPTHFQTQPSTWHQSLPSDPGYAASIFLGWPAWCVSFY